jgi:hypothetical protein
MSDTGVQPESVEKNLELEAAVGDHELSQDERAELERLRAQTAELEHLRAQMAELEQLRARIAELERRPAETAEPQAQRVAVARRRHVGWRTPVAVVLIVLGCVLAPLAVISVWAGDEVSNTGRYVATVEPLIHHPAIQNYLTDQITNQITSRINLIGIVNQASAQLSSKGLTKISSLLTQFGPQIASVIRLKFTTLISMLLLCRFLSCRWRCLMRTGLSLSGWRAAGIAALRSVPGSCWHARTRPEGIPGWRLSWGFPLRRCGSGARGSPGPGRPGSRTPRARDGGRRISC